MRRVISLATILIAAGIVMMTARVVLDQPEPVTVTAARAVPVADQPGVLHVYLTLQNGGMPNRLLSASSPDAQEARFAGALGGDLVLPADGTPSLSSDGVYLELIGVSGEIEPGRLIPISLEFDRAGTATTRALIGAPLDPHAMHKQASSAEHAGHSNHAGHGTAPTMSMGVSRGEAGLWSVALETQHFRFVPDAPDPVHVPGEGHGHLYLNGLKLQRMYSETAVIGALPPGQYTARVTLNTNTHNLYETPEGPVVAEQLINVE